MKKLYIIVSTLFVLSILLFISAFIYLDREGHRAYHYIINLDGYDIGTIRVDKFVTEDKFIYKSVSSLPSYPVLTDSKSKIVLDRGYNLENYSKENFGKGVKETLYIENNQNSASFIATFQSEFAVLNNIPIRKGTFIFEEDSPMAYMPIIENYDFRRGRAQGFNALSSFATFLPPMKRYVTLTSVRDEYLKVDSRRIKTECLLLKIKNYPQGMVWVSKLDRSLVALEMPNRLLKIRRTFLPKAPLLAREYRIEAKGNVTKDVNFKNKNIKLAGTLSTPEKEGKYPLVLLIWGPGAQDRHYQGLFTSIADYLSKSGYCVFSFDKRGVGSSEGDFSGTTDGDEIEDLNIALEFLTTQGQGDPKKAFIIGHSKGAFYASLLASKKDAVKGVILMAPSAPAGTDIETLKAMASQLKWSEDYLKLAMKSSLETTNMVKAAKNNWASILGKRSYLKRIREELDEDPVAVIKEVKAPALILQGKEDYPFRVDYASLLDKSLEESGNLNHTLTYFGYLGHYFGKSVNDGVHKIHYEVDPAVLETIKTWLDSVVSPQQDLRN